MKKIFLLIIILTLLITNGFSQFVSGTDASIVGINFVSSMKQEFIPEKMNTEISKYLKVTDSKGEELIHIYNFKNGGFVMVSADERVAPILAYSFETSFDLENIAPATKEWLSIYTTAIEEVRENNYEASDEIMDMWERFYNNSFNKIETKGVNKLLTTRWNQNYPYNYFCPLHPAGPGGRVYAGCVATAMAQVMKYYDYPETGRFTYQYFWGDYIEIDFGATTYRWDEMTNSINTLSRDAIAELIFHCGVSVDMDYDYTGSGSTIQRVFFALKQFFKYRSGMELVEMFKYELDEWQYLLIQDLDRGKPIIYRGNSNQGDGHAYVVDGYQGTSFFHFNWGWGGSADGFFYLEIINPLTLFPHNQGALVNVDPYYADYCGSITYRQPAWTFDDGSGPNLYFNNTNCEWLIAPEVDEFDYIKLSFNRLNLLEGDTLKIFNGNNKNTDIIGSFTGNFIPSDLHIESNEILITFESSDSGQSTGWEISYETIVLNACSISGDKLEIFPNPTQNVIYVKTGTEIISNVSIIDINGRVLKTEIGKQNISIDISNVSAGLYFIVVENENYKSTKRIVKQ